MSKRANNEGTICKRTKTVNGKTYSYWEAKVTIGKDINGNVIRKSFSGKTQKEVKEKMINAASAVINKEYFEPSKATLKQWIEIWLNEYCNHLKYQTRKSYKAQCQTHIIPALGNIKLSELTAPLIQAFYNELGRTGHSKSKVDKTTNQIVTTYSALSPKSIKNIHSILSKCLNTAIDVKYLKENPCSRTSLPVIEKKEINPLTESQIKEFIRKLDEEEYSALYKIIAFTGVRKAEALGMTWDSINLKTGVWHVYKQLIKKPIRDGGYAFDTLKNHKSRYLLLPPYLIDILKKRKEEQEQDKKTAGKAWSGYQTEEEHKNWLVFTTKDGRPINPKTAYKHYKKIVKEMGIEESRVHDLRHTYAVISLMNGDNIKILQSNLGHSSASTTLNIYAHATELMKSDSSDKMQKYISNIIDPEDKK